MSPSEDIIYQVPARNGETQYLKRMKVSREEVTSDGKLYHLEDGTVINLTIDGLETFVIVDDNGEPILDPLNNMPTIEIRPLIKMDINNSSSVYKTE